MLNHFDTLKLEKPKVFADQIRDAVRDLLVSGRFADGERIPSSRMLATTWGTNRSTVDVALASLEKEGLLVRYHGKGTFVRKPEKKLKCVGIYYTEDVWTHQASGFRAAIHRSLKELLKAEGIETTVWVDPRPYEERETPWLPLVRAVERGDIQGLIYTQADWVHMNWMNRLAVPSSHWATSGLPNAVSHDMAQFVELGVSSLADQGCQSVGFICPVPTEAKDFWGKPNHYTILFEQFVEVCARRGLKIHNEWILANTPDLLGKTQEQKGYELFNKLWSQPSHPGGLLVFTDNVANGVMTAILQARVNVPGELKLAMHKNAGVELFCPVPATWVMLDEREIARQLLDSVQKQYRGEKSTHQEVQYRLEQHEGQKNQLFTK